MTSIDLPSDLVEQTKAATGESTLRGAVIASMRQAVARDRQREAITAMADLAFLADLVEPEVAERARR